MLVKPRLRAASSFRQTKALRRTPERGRSNWLYMIEDVVVVAGGFELSDQRREAQPGGQGNG